MICNKLKNWAFKTFFPEEYKTVDDVKQKEIDRHFYVNGVVEFLNQKKQELGEEKFIKFWGGKNGHHLDYIAGVIPHDWEERINAKIAELNEEKTQEN
jgi:hypothetical protein